MCGIVGVVFENIPLAKPQSPDNGIAHTLRRDSHLFHYLYNSLFYLQMRGQDSVGMCTVDRNSATFAVSKHSVNHKDNPDGKYIFDLLRDDLYKHTGDIGIGHTRYATLGCKNNENAHPHLSNCKTIAVVHNGHIDNSADLLSFLRSKKFKFIGHSDSELIPNYLQYLCQTHPSDSFCETIARLQEIMTGKWACLAINLRHPDCIFFFKNNMPLVLSQSKGKYKNKTVLVSDPHCFLESFPEYLCLGDNVVGFVSKDRTFIDSKNYKICPNDMTKIDSVFIDFEKNLFNTRTVYMLQNLDNIYETICNVRYEYKVSRNIMVKETRVVPGLDHVQFHTLSSQSTRIARAKSITLIGAGTSFHTATAIKCVLQRMEIFDQVTCLDALNYSVYDLTQDSIYVVISQTSENKYIEKAVETIITLFPNALLIGVFNNVLAAYVKKRLCAYVLLNAGIEFSLSYVKAFVSQYFCLYLLAGYLAQIKNKTVPYQNISFIFCDYQHEVSYVIKNQHFFRGVAEKIAQCDNILVVGGNDLMPFACEAALKFREISYANAFALHYNQLHNGYYHLLQKRSFILLLHDRHQNHNEFCHFVHHLLLDETNLSTDFKSLIFSNELNPWASTCNNCDCDIDKYFDIFPFQISLFNAPTYLIASMYLAYFIANVKGINPDRPRG